MTDNDVKALALFFFYSILDDRRALQLASLAADILSEKLAKSPTANNRVELIKAAQVIWQKNRGRWFRGRPHYSVDSGWLLPAHLDLSAWKEFQKSALEDELIALVWSKIVGAADEDIAVALEISSGTLRYRIGRALKKMGSMIETGGARKFEVVKI